MNGNEYRELITGGANIADKLCHDGRGRANFAMVDGHVESMNGRLLLDGSANIAGGNYTGSWIDHRK